MDVLVFSTRYVYLRGVYNGFSLKVSLGWLSVVETAIYSVVGYFDIAALWELRCHMQWLWRFWKSSCFFYDLLEILL